MHPKFPLHADSYLQSACSVLKLQLEHLAKPHIHPQVLSQSVVGASQQDTQLDEDVDSKPLAAQQQDTGATNKYEVVGTLQDAKAQKPEWVTEIVKVW